ncbi:hypothetical protein Slin14017_G107200 [Septoria linicola]|nr:hypothetical protein Slin14017_G107200 [Septoria linicola]
MARSLRSNTGTPSPPVTGHAKLLASATLKDIGHRFDILNYLELLRKTEQVLRLRLRQRRQGSGPVGHGLNDLSFLGAVLRMPRFQHIRTHDLEIDWADWGKEWRRRPDEIESRHVSENNRNDWQLPALNTLEDVPLHHWGPSNHDNGASLFERCQIQDWPQYMLIVHPWGPDVLMLVETPGRSVVSPSPTTQSARCCLCKSELSLHENDESLCVFHPGVKECNASESSSITEDSDEGDQSWTCCHRDAGDPGCMVESHHLAAEQVRPGSNGEVWRRSWDNGTGGEAIDRHDEDMIDS